MGVHLSRSCSSLHINGISVLLCYVVVVVGGRWVRGWRRGVNRKPGGCSSSSKLKPEKDLVRLELVMQTLNPLLAL